MSPSAAHPLLRRSGILILVLAVSSALLVPPSQAAPHGEVEPNDTRNQAQLLELPVDHFDEMGGRIDDPGDVDFYAFNVPARMLIRATVEPYGTKVFDPVIHVLGPAGETLDARVSNGRTLGAYARTAGRYFLRVAHASPSAYGHQYGFDVVNTSYPPEQEGWHPTPVYPPQWYGMGPNSDYASPSSVEVADIDADGRGDVLLSAHGATAHGQPALYAFPGRASGALGRPRRWLLPTPPHDAPTVSMGVSAGQLVGTAAKDVAVGTFEGVQLFEQRDGDLVRGALLRTPYAVNTVFVIDMNQDGRNDIVANTWRGILVLRRTAAGFASPLRVVSLSQLQLHVANVAGDARPDLIGIRDDAYVRVYRQRSDGTFSAPTMLMVQHGDYINWLDGLAVGDLTSDGQRDIAVQNNGYLNIFVRTTGGFAKPRVLQVGRTTPIRQVADLDRDGDPELAGTSDLIFLNDEVSIDRTLHLNGDGGFGPDITAVGDVDGDGDGDLATAGADGPVVFRGGFTP